MCEQCISFKDFYNFSNQPLILSEAKKASLLVANTDEGRIERGKYDVKRTTNVVKVIDGKEKQLTKIEWTNRADHTTEGRTHAGYVVYDDTVKDIMIYELWCCCADFFFRLWYTYNKQGMSPWKLESKYEKRNALRAKANNGKYPIHNRQKQKYKWTNVDQNEFLCKHLLNIVFFYILGKFKEDSKIIPLNKDKELKEPVKKVEPKVPMKVEPKKVEPKKVEPKVPPKVEPKKVEPIKKEVVPKGKEVELEPEVKGK